MLNEVIRIIPTPFASLPYSNSQTPPMLQIIRRR